MLRLSLISVKAGGNDSFAQPGWKGASTALSSGGLLAASQFAPSSQHCSFHKQYQKSLRVSGWPSLTILSPVLNDGVPNPHSILLLPLIIHILHVSKSPFALSSFAHPRQTHHVSLRCFHLTPSGP